MAFELPGLYPITDVALSGLPHAEQVARLCEGGARLVQLREKRLAPRDFYREAEAALKVARSFGARLVVNDRADIALALGADGVHLGQDDLPPEAARSLLGPDALIGFSTHSVEQAAEAARLAVDYVAIGPVFATSSKENPDPVVGLEGVRRVREADDRVRVLFRRGGEDRAYGYVVNGEARGCGGLLDAVRREAHERVGAEQ